MNLKFNGSATSAETMTGASQGQLCASGGPYEKFTRLASSRGILRAIVSQSRCGAVRSDYCLGVPPRPQSQAMNSLTETGGMGLEGGKMSRMPKSARRWE